MSAKIICFVTGDKIDEEEYVLLGDSEAISEEDKLKLDKEYACLRIDAIKAMTDQFIDDGYDMSRAIIIAPHVSGERLSSLFVQLDANSVLEDSAELLVDGYFKIRAVIDEIEDS